MSGVCFSLSLLACVCVSPHGCVFELSWLCSQSVCGSLAADSWSEVCHLRMEVLEHRNSSDVGGSLMQSSLELGVTELDSIGDTQSCASQVKTGGTGMGEENAGSLEIFRPGEAEDEQASSVVVAEALRCQVKITTRRSLHLRIANHTARDVYVRLVGHGGRIAGSNTGTQKSILEHSKIDAKVRNILTHIGSMVCSATFS